MSKDISSRKFYKKLRKYAIRHKKGERGLLFFFGVRVEKSVYCGMRYFVFIPKEVETGKCVMYVHGSGYMNGYCHIQAKFAADLARHTHAKVYFPLYPKLPLSTVVPCFALLRNFYAFLLKKGDVFSVGDSSGASLALSLNEERDESSSVIAISPWVSLRIGEEGRSVKSDAILSLSTMERVAHLWAYDLPYEDVRLSPAFGRYVGKDLTIFAGECEILTPDIRDFVHEQSNKGASVTYYEGTGQQHCYPLMPTPEGRAAREAIYRKLSAWIYGASV